MRASGGPGFTARLIPPGRNVYHGLRALRHPRRRQRVTSKTVTRGERNRDSGVHAKAGEFAKRTKTLLGDRSDAGCSRFMGRRRAPSPRIGPKRPTISAFFPLVFSGNLQTSRRPTSRRRVERPWRLLTVALRRLLLSQPMTNRNLLRVE